MWPSSPQLKQPDFLAGALAPESPHPPVAPAPQLSLAAACSPHASVIFWKSEENVEIENSSRNVKKNFPEFSSWSWAFKIDVKYATIIITM